MENINYLYGETSQDILAKHYLANLIGCDTPKNKEFFFDGNSEEYYTTENDGDRLIKLHFLSGHVVEVFSELDEDLYSGESVDTLVDKCICRYFDDDK